MNLGELIAKGNTAKIYLHENKVIKLFEEYLPNTESTNEAKKQKYAYSCGLPVPNVFEVTKIQNRQAIIMEYVKGENIGELLLNNLNKAEHYINICVNEQKKIHSIRVNIDEMEPMRERLECQIKSVHKLDENKKKNILQKLDSIDIRADVFRTYLLYAQASVELAEMYLHMYCRNTGLSRDEIFQWAPIIITARFAEKISPHNAVYLNGVLDQYV
ncbi:aminoglycoside phosphotransferase [Bacillus toyonensis]|uniref:aminoglycoside phosphotransferase n=1 Tax=Bacillus toyonensis TaxID=155322 RepID=UPI000BFD0E29|nr:aminoglycoside phosphotransferase [Bacillus toyonensis]PHB24821.1 aminoglycoside phosphotransferase [Bacillus toyonensis]